MTCWSLDLPSISLGKQEEEQAFKTLEHRSPDYFLFDFLVGICFLHTFNTANRAGFDLIFTFSPLATRAG